MNTNTQLQKVTQPSKPSALVVMASRLSVEPAKMLATLKNTVFKNASDEELIALTVVANEYQLNPFLKEIYAFPAKGGGIVPVVSVDGWNKMLIRQPDFDGIEFEFNEQDGQLVSCTATIHIKNRSHPVRITEYLDECKRNTDPWNHMPRRMLRNRTLCQASRVAFGFAGVYNDDEASDVIDIAAVSSPTPANPQPKVIPLANPQPEQTGAPEPTKQQQLAAIILGAGFTFSQFQKWASGSGHLEDAASLPDFEAVPSEVAGRLIRAKTGLLKGMTEMGGEAK